MTVLMILTVLLVCATALLIAVGVSGRRFSHREPVRGRTVAIVPVGEEEGLTLRETVLALAGQTIAPDEIHVMDDGSPMPVKAFSQPTVTWHWQPRQGRRKAQANLLRQFCADDWDFVFAVDVASPPAPDALENLLRSMNDGALGASTLGAHELVRANLVYNGADIESGLAAEGRRAVPLLVSLAGRRPRRTTPPAPSPARNRVGAA